MRGSDDSLTQRSSRKSRQHNNDFLFGRDQSSAGADSSLWVAEDRHLKTLRHSCTKSALSGQWCGLKPSGRDSSSK